MSDQNAGGAAAGAAAAQGPAPAPAPGRTVVSSRNFDRIQQEGPNWCYAATERMIKSAYGVAVGTQQQIAQHYWTVIEAPADSVLQGYIDYVRGENPDMSDADVRAEALVQASATAVQNNPGTCQFDGMAKNVYQGAVPPDADIKACFGGGHLGMMGAGPHLTVAYGYEEDGTGAVTKILRWDPLLNAEDPITMVAFRGTASSIDTFLFT